MNQKKKKLLEEYFQGTIKIKRMMDQVSNVSVEDKVATILQMHALTYLSEHAGSTVGELGQFLHMSSSAIAQFTDRLVSSSLIKRIPDEKDRRIIRLVLTAKGEKQRKKLHEQMLEKMSKFLDYISDEDLESMVAINARIILNIENKQ